jgi:parallel beta-helix repeat protein
VKKNYVKGSIVGISAHDLPQFAFDDYILIEENIIHGNQIGIEFAQTDKNTVRRNVISNNIVGIRLEESSDNTFSRNKFINNVISYIEFNSHGNGLIVPLSWQAIVLWSFLGVFGISSIILSVLYIPKRIKRVKTNKTLELGELLRSEKKYNDALALYDKILTKDPSNEPALNKKIAILYELKRYEDISELLKGNPPKQE